MDTYSSLYRNIFNFNLCNANSSLVFMPLHKCHFLKFYPDKEGPPFTLYFHLDPLFVPLTVLNNYFLGEGEALELTSL